MIYLQLFFQYAKVGLFSIGGGLATLPFLYDLSDSTGWFTYAQLADMIAISESTPGAIGINMATYVGYLTAGVLGGIIATLGLIFPSITIILIIARFLNAYRSNDIVSAAFYGLRPASVALIAAAGFTVMKITLLNIGAYTATKHILDLFQWKAILLAALLFVLTNKWKIHPIVYIAGSAVIGILLGLGAA